MRGICIATPKEGAVYCVFVIHMDGYINLCTISVWFAECKIAELSSSNYVCPRLILRQLWIQWVGGRTRDLRGVQWKFYRVLALSERFSAIQLHRNTTRSNFCVVLVRKFCCYAFGACALENFARRVHHVRDDLYKVAFYFKYNFHSKWMQIFKSYSSSRNIWMDFQLPTSGKNRGKQLL